MAAIPPDVVKQRKIVEETLKGSGDESSEMDWEALQFHALNLSSEGYEDFQAYVLSVEEYLRQLPLKYQGPILRKIEQEKKAFLDRQFEKQEKLAEQRRYAHFDVSENDVILPEGDDLSQLVDRFSGFQIVTVVDTNRNGIPDSGDTGIDRYGDYHKNIQFTENPTAYGDLGKQYFSPLCYPDHCKALATRFDVRHLKPDSPERLAINLANNSAEYASGIEGQASDMLGEMGDNKLATSAVIVGATALYACPYTRPVMAGLTILFGGGGAGYLVYDRVEGIQDEIEGKNDARKMGQYDLIALLAMFGAAPELKGITVGEFMAAPARGAVGAARYVGETMAAGVGRGGGGGMELAWAGAGAGGGSVSVSGVGALEGACVAEGGAVAGAGWMFGSSFAMSVGVSLALNRPEKSYRLDIEEEFQPIAEWKGSKAAEAADDIELWMMEAGLPEEEIAQFRQHVNALKEIYARSPDEPVQADITKALQDVLADMDAARNSGVPLDSAASPTKRDFYGKFDRIVKQVRRAKDGRRFVKRVKVQRTLEIPDGVVLADGVEDGVVSDEGKKAALESGMKALIRFSDDGRRVGDIQSVGGKVFEFRDHSGPGYRVYFAESGTNGSRKATILRVGTKGSQEGDISFAKRKAEDLGLGAIYMYVVDENAD